MGFRGGQSDRPGPGVGPRAWLGAVVLLIAATARAQDAAPPATAIDHPGAFIDAPESPPAGASLGFGPSLLAPASAAVDLPADAPSPVEPPVPEEPPAPVEPPVPEESPAPVDPNVLLTACAACGDFHAAPTHPGPCGAEFGCGPGGCVPGRKNACYGRVHTHFLGRFIDNLYQCLCCPDPCYEPRWVPEANAALFVDHARPRTIQRFRWEHGASLWFPDRSEYFWARSYKGEGPQPRRPRGRRGAPIYGERNLDYDQLTLYTEAATARFAFFTEFGYRSVDPQITPHHAGFSDMNIGTKSLLLDCELLQLTFQFKTFFPIGDASKGLGNGHISLEPSLLMSLHLARGTYLQGQLSEWVPMTFDEPYAGSILHYHFSLNRTLWHCYPDVPLIGMIEFNGWSFQDGLFTSPALGPRRSAGDSYLTLGPGLRLSICDQIDLGLGAAFALDTPNFGNPILRAEIRILY